MTVAASSYERVGTERRCKDCGIVKPLDPAHFPWNSARETGRSFGHRCRTCVAARNRKRWATDPRAKELDQAFRDKNRDKIRAYDRMRAKRDKAKKDIIIKRWIENNPERHREIARASAARRRARIMAVGGSFSADDVARMLEAQKGRCWWCNKKLSKRFEVDHRVPIAKGGRNDPSNLVLSCMPCNREKSAKMPWEFAGRLL